MNIDPKFPKYGVYDKLFYFIVLNHEPFQYHIGITQVLENPIETEAGFEYKCKSFITPVPESCLFKEEFEAQDALGTYLVERKNHEQFLAGQNKMLHEPE